MPPSTAPLTKADLALLHQLIAVACERHHGDLTVMRFASNWRVGFGTPRDRHDISRMPQGATFADAARFALTDPRPLYDYPNDTEKRFVQVWGAKP